MKYRLMEDMKKALRENDTIKKNTIQLLRASILQAEKDSQKILTNSDIENIIAKEKKKRIDALVQFQKGNRKDLVEQTEKEIACIAQYLPQPIHIDELKEEVMNIIKQNNATKNDIGLVMRLSKEKFGNRIDGKTLSDIVKQLLEDKNEI